MKINSLDYLGSVNLARIFEDPEAIVARGLNAAYDVNRLWFEPRLPAGSPPMVTLVPVPEGTREAMEEYGGSGVIDFDVKAAPTSAPWYIISVEGSDFGPAVSLYIPEGADQNGADAVRKAWESAR